MPRNTNNSQSLPLQQLVYKKNPRLTYNLKDLKYSAQEVSHAYRLELAAFSLCSLSEKSEESEAMRVVLKIIAGKKVAGKKVAGKKLSGKTTKVTFS